MSYIEDGGGGLPYPPGDPGELRSAAAGLRSAAGEMTSVTSSTSGAAEASLAQWQGAAASSFSTLTSAMNGGLSVMSPAYSQAATAVAGYADALEDAQRTARAAASAYADAVSTYSRASSLGNAALDDAATLTGDAATAATTAANAALNRAYDTYVDAAGAAERKARGAVEAATHAAQAAASAIRTIADGIHSEIYSKVVEGYGWTGPGFGLLAPVGGSLALKDLAAAMGDLRHGAYEKFAEFDRAGFEASEKAAAEFGPKSAEALKSWMSFAQTASAEAKSEGITDVLHALSGAGKGGDAALSDLSMLDKLGRFGIGVAAVGDVLTITDGDATGLDKGVSAANLVGAGMWATSTAAGDTALGLIGIANTADWVPGVGEVVMGGTALFLAGEFAYQHRKQLEAAGKDVYHAAEWLGDQEIKAGGAAVRTAVAAGKVTVAAVEDAGKLTVQVADDGIQVAGQAVRSTVHLAETGAKDVASTAVATGEDVYDGGKSVVKTIGGWLP